MKHMIPALPDADTNISALRRPQLLVTAAHYMVARQSKAAQKHSLARIIMMEAECEHARIARDGRYQPEAHIRALAALITAIKGANAAV